MVEQKLLLTSGHNYYHLLHLKLFKVLGVKLDHLLLQEELRKDGYMVKMLHGLLQMLKNLQLSVTSV